LAFEFSGMLSPDDFRDAFRVHYRRRWFSYLVLYPFCFCLLGFLLVLLFKIPIGNHPLKLLLLGVFAFGGGTMGYYGCFLLIRRKIIKAFERQPSLRGQQSWSFDESGVSYHSEKVTAQFSWTDYVRWKEDEAVFVIYPSDLIFHVVPKRWAVGGEPAVKAVRGLLQSSIGTQRE
jgi:hypothetical protein